MDRISKLNRYKRMLITKKEIIVNGENKMSELQYFDQPDIKIFQKVYEDWILLNKLLRTLKSRTINIPEALTEGLASLYLNAPRVINVYDSVSSFDCFDLTRNKMIQIKSSSVEFDLTTFGPKSIWDELYFCDFFVKGNWNGDFDIYKIPNELIYSQKVNKNETFVEQQSQGRRPRFSIKKNILLKENIKPFISCNIFS